MNRLRGAWNEFASWHRGLPDPPGKPKLTLSLMRRALRESNALYFRTVREFYGGLFGIGRTAAADRLKKEAEETERASDAAAKALADGAAATAADGPAMLRRWLTPRIALFSGALVEFGRGFREGKNAPDIKLDLASLLKSTKSAKDSDKRV
jgi:hypothetical protein